MKYFSIVYPITVMLFCLGLSLSTYSPTVKRGVASSDVTTSSGFHYYDASYKL